MTIDSKIEVRSGSALMIVLLVVAMVAILSLGFITRSDSELACGRNVAVRMQTDYLAWSGLAHAKTLLVNPQNADTVSAGYWQGATDLQIDASTGDYYDLAIVRDTVGATPKCTYDITSTGYRMAGATKIAQSKIKARLRLNPFIAYRQKTSRSMPSVMTVHGDVYSDDNITIASTVNGDIYCLKTITGTGFLGQKFPLCSSVISDPDITTTEYNPYYYIGATQYSSSQKNAGTYSSISWNTSGVYVYYCDASGDTDLNLSGTCTINGTLVVAKDLQLQEDCNLTITPAKDFPALVVGRDVNFAGDDAKLTVNGYAQIGGKINMDNKTGSKVTVTGALFTNDGIEKAVSVTITADPVAAVIQKWKSDGTAVLWTPAAGGFFKSIQRL